MSGNTGCSGLNAFQRGALEVSKQRPERLELIKRYFEKRGVKVWIGAVIRATG